MFKSIAEKLARKAPACFCDAIKPITIFCQCVGVLPLKFRKHAACSSSSDTSTPGIRIPAKALNMNMLDNPSPPDALACGHNFKFRWISWPSFVNAIWIAGFTATALWVQIHLPAILQQRYIGIDLYVQYVPLFTTYYELVLILLLTRWKAKEIAEVWAKIGEIFHVMKTNRGVPALKPIMFQAWLLLALTILPSVGYMYNAINLPGNVWPTLVQCLPAVFFTAFAIHFLTLCTILRFLNRELSAWLGQALKAVASTSTKSICLQTIRLAHADLSRAVAMASDCFGMQALILMCTIVVSVTLNAYKIMSIAPSMQGESKGLPYLWGFYLYFEIFALTCLLMGGQFVKDLGNIPRQVIYEAEYQGHGDSSRFEVLILLDQVKNMPEVTAGGLVDIRMSVLSSAVTTIATYLLVLLQFRMTSTAA